MRRPTGARNAGNPLPQRASKSDNETSAPGPAQRRDNDVTVAVRGDDDPVGAEPLGDRPPVVEPPERRALRRLLQAGIDPNLAVGTHGPYERHIQRLP